MFTHSSLFTHSNFIRFMDIITQKTNNMDLKTSKKKKKTYENKLIMDSEHITNLASDFYFIMNNLNLIKIL